MPLKEVQTLLKNLKGLQETHSKLEDQMQKYKTDYDVQESGLKKQIETVRKDIEASKEELDSIIAETKDPVEGPKDVLKKKLVDTFKETRKIPKWKGQGTFSLAFRIPKDQGVFDSRQRPVMKLTVVRYLDGKDVQGQWGDDHFGTSPLVTQLFHSLKARLKGVQITSDGKAEVIPVDKGEENTRWQIRIDIQVRLSKGYESRNQIPEFINTFKNVLKIAREEVKDLEDESITSAGGERDFSGEDLERVPRGEDDTQEDEEPVEESAEIDEFEEEEEKQSSMNEIYSNVVAHKIKQALNVHRGKTLDSRLWSSAINNIFLLENVESAGKEGKEFWTTVGKEAPEEWYAWIEKGRTESSDKQPSRVYFKKITGVKNGKFEYDEKQPQISILNTNPWKFTPKVGEYVFRGRKILKVLHDSNLSKLIDEYKKESVKEQRR